MLKDKIQKNHNNINRYSTVLYLCLKIKYRRTTIILIDFKQYKIICNSFNLIVFVELNLYSVSNILIDYYCLSF